MNAQQETAPEAKKAFSFSLVDTLKHRKRARPDFELKGENLM
jgi:hypothetical protein